MDDSLEGLRRAGLTPRQISIMAWTFYDGVSESEIGHRLRITKQAVSRTLARGCARLEKAGFPIPARPDGGDGSAWETTMSPEEMDNLTPAQIVGVA